MQAAVSSANNDVIAVAHLEPWQQLWWQLFIRNVLIHLDAYTAAVDLLLHLVLLSRWNHPRISTTCIACILAATAIAIVQLYFLTGRAAVNLRYYRYRTYIIIVRRLCNLLVIRFNPFPEPLLVGSYMSALRTLHLCTGLLPAFTTTFHCRMQLPISFALSILGQMMIGPLHKNVCKPDVLLGSRYGLEVLYTAALSFQWLAQLGSASVAGHVGKVLQQGDSAQQVQQQAVCAAVVNTLQVVFGMLLPHLLVLIIEEVSKVYYWEQVAEQTDDAALRQQFSGQHRRRVLIVVLLVCAQLGVVVLYIGTTFAWAVALVVHQLL